MNNRQVVEALAEHWDMSLAETRRLLDTIVETFKDHLGEGTGFTVPELGTFQTSTRDKRKAYNPHHKQYMMLPPKRVVKFSPSKGLKEDLKHAEPENE